MENSSLRGRFSLSTTNLSNPIAESTCLNGSSSHAKFNWGEVNTSVRNRNNTLAANKNTSMSKNLNGTPHKVTMSPSSRIDPRTYVDIHSNGLASRIVKYHDNSARLNRSLSMGSLYNKPGQFPVVHLKKNELQYKAKKNRNLSMTKIAAPEKSVFHGNTLSSILRSGSIVGLQKSDEEISHENRPIIHPPPTENEMAPTRSVLEVLKEISRKRINSDELDGTELIKKYCKEPDYDAIPYNGQKTQSKRQREMSTSASSSVQISPEQQAVKRRMCNYNNDIMSSLSSSMISINKKKILEMQSQKRTASDLLTGNTSTTTTTETESMRSEKQHCMQNFDLENLGQSNKYTPITPLPSTPQQSTMSCGDMDKNPKGLVTRRASEPVISSTKPKLTLFNKDYDEVATKVRNDIADPGQDGDLCGIQFVKPKKNSSLSAGGTLLMEKTKKSKLALMLCGLKGELNEEDEVDAVPKTEQQNQVEVTASVATTSATSVPSTQAAAISFGTTTTTATTLTPTPDASVPTAKQSPIKGVLQFKPPATTISVSSSTSNGFHIPPTTATAHTSSTPALILQPATTTSAPISTGTSTATSIPTLGGFSFGLNKPLTLPTTTTTAPNSQSQPTVPQITPAMSTPASTKPTTVAGTASAMKPFGFGLPTTQGPTSTAPSFTFGAPNTTLSTTQAPPMASAFAPAPITTTKTSTAPPPVFGQTSTANQPTFSFGSLAASNANSTTNALTTATSAPPASSAPSFNFGAVKSSWAPSTAQAPVNANPIVGTGSFGGISTSTSTSQSTSTLSSTTSTGGFSFAGSSSTEPTKTLFGSMVPATTTPPNSNTTFSFAPNKTPVTQANPTSAFTFGSPAAPPAAMSNPIQPPAFGSTTPVKPTNSFSFGAPAPAAPLKNSFSFPSTDKPAGTATSTGSSVGGFSFNAPGSNSNPPDSNKNIFGNAAPAVVPAKPAFSFGSAPSNQATSKPTMFGASGIKPTNLFGAAPPTTTQSPPFGFGSSSGTSTNQGVTATAPSTNLFGSVPSNQTGSLGASTNSSASIFGSQSAAVAPLQQSSTFTFGASSNATTTESNKPAGGFVFGSSSSIGSNASKPATDMSKTFVFGDGSTTITPAPPGATNVFGGSNATNGGAAGATENKIFSFGGAGAGPAGGNNTFGGNRQTVNPSPSFTFGSASSATPVPAQNGNLFAPQPTGQPSERPIRKAMRRLHKT